MKHSSIHKKLQKNEKIWWFIIHKINKIKIKVSNSLIIRVAAIWKSNIMGYVSKILISYTNFCLVKCYINVPWLKHYSIVSISVRCTLHIIVILWLKSSSMTRIMTWLLWYIVQHRDTSYGISKRIIIVVIWTFHLVF